MAQALFGPRSPFNADRIAHGVGNCGPLPSFTANQLETESPVSRSSMSAAPPLARALASVGARSTQEGISFVPASPLTRLAQVSGNEAPARPQSAWRAVSLSRLC